MDLFKRITDLLTPPPQKQAKPPVTADASDEASAITVNLGQTVKSLVAAPALEHPQATQAIAELKHIASTTGLYVVASKMRYQLDAMPRITSNGTVNAKDRGYVLAADFIYQHISRDIREMESLGRAIGPNIFRSYCNELVSCLLYGKNALRAIEMPVVIIEDLLHLSVASGPRRDLYLELADVAATATVTQTVAKLDADQRERNRRRQEEKRGDTPAALPADPQMQLDAEAVLYAKHLQERIDQIRRELTTITPVPVPRAGTAPEAVRGFADYLQTLIAIAERAAFSTFSVFLQVHLAGLYTSVNSQEATNRLRLAAERLQSIAADEQKLNFAKLSSRRLIRAAELYTHLGDQAAAQECRARSNGR